jgi:hypothetical protein
MFLNQMSIRGKDIFDGNIKLIKLWMEHVRKRKIYITENKFEKYFGMINFPGDGEFYSCWWNSENCGTLGL